MKSKVHRNTLRVPHPTVSGLGLVAFDYVTDSRGTRLHSQAGGTCGNVLAILAAFGWHASPIARLDMDTAGRWVRADLNRFGVDTRWIDLPPVAETPVVIERLLRDSAGVPFHCFSFCCPGCGGWLPRFRPVPVSALREVMHDAARADVVFIDRISPAAFALAEDAFVAEALVFFEPSGSTSERELKRILPFVNVLKYSHERLDKTLDTLPESVFLELQTLGRGGLRFRLRSKQTGRMRPWMHMDSYPVESLVDSAGAGDWFSAGLIHLLCKGPQSARTISEPDIVQAISKAQRLAAWSCNFVGARGAMYGAPLDSIKQVLYRAKIKVPTTAHLPSSVCDTTLLCSTCRVDQQSAATDSELPTRPLPH